MFATRVVLAAVLALTGVTRALPQPALSFDALALSNGENLKLDDSWLTNGEALAGTAAGLQLTREDSEPSSVSSAFSSTVTNLQEGSMFVKMRVAGSERNGVTATGLWLTRNVPNTRGPHTFAGMSPDFEGVGVVLRLSTDNDASDAALEAEHSIHVYQNPDGRRSEKDVVDYATKCIVPSTALTRVSTDPSYFDFSFKIMQYQGMLFVLFDPTNQNLFQECVTQPLDGAHEVLAAARVGFTAAAPSLRAAGGNHGHQEHRAQAVTVLSARADTRWDHDPGVVMHEHPGMHDAASGMDAGGVPQAPLSGADGPTAAHAADIDAELSKLQLHEWASEQRLAKLETALHEQLERRLDALEASLKNSMGSKLGERIQALEAKIRDAAETALVERIAHLEQQFRSDVETKLMARVEGIEEKLRGNIDAAGHGVKHETSTKLTERLAALEASMKNGLAEEIQTQIKGQDASTRTWVGQIAQKLDARAENGVARLKDQVGALGGDASWQMPFAVLVMLVLAAAVVMWKQYKSAQKQHLF